VTGAKFQYPAMEMLLEERDFLWRAIDLLVQEIAPGVHTSQWFRTEWENLVIERQTHAWAAPEPEGTKP
jgi:hypothetical protein